MISEKKTGGPTAGGALDALVYGRDWAATPLGDPLAWPPFLRALLATMLASPLPMVLAWGPELTTLHNEAYRPLLDDKPDALGRPFLEVWGEARETLAPLLARALAGEACRHDTAPFTLRRRGRPETAFFDFSLSPLRDDAGAAVGVLKVGVETTAHVRAERRQAFRLGIEERLRALVDPEAIIRETAALLGRHLGVDRVGYCEIADDADVRVAGFYAADGIAPLHEGLPIESFGQALLARQRQGITEVSDDVLAEPDRADDLWTASGTRSVVSVPLIRDGRLRALLFVGDRAPRHWQAEDVALIEEVAARTWDAVERARAEAALRESEARFRALVTASSDVLYRMGPDWAEIRQLSGSRFLADTPAPTRDWLADYIHPDDQPRVLAAIGEAIRTRAVFELEHRVLRPDGSLDWTFSRAVPILDERGEITEWFGAARDITARKQAEEALRQQEERQALLAREVGHRAKNALAVAQSLIQLTPPRDPAAFKRAVTGRIAALARAQTLLAGDRWRGADLHTLLAGELAPFMGDRRAELDGPPVTLPPGAAQPVAMAIHELATNAVKYGALSAASGRLAVSWRLERGSDDVPLLMLRWAETGGPVVHGAPGHRGFGSRVLERTVQGQLGGRVSLAWETSGLLCAMEVPLKPAAAPGGAAGTAAAG